MPVLLAIVDTCSPGESGKIFVCNYFLVKGGKEKKVLPRRTEKSINQSHLFSQPGDVFPGSVVTAGGVVPGVVPGSVVPAGGVVATTQLVCCTCGKKVLSLVKKIHPNPLADASLNQTSPDRLWHQRRICCQSPTFRQ